MALLARHRSRCIKSDTLFSGEKNLMGKKRNWQRWVVRLMCCVFVTPGSMRAGELPSNPLLDGSLRSIDVRLDTEGHFGGQVLNRQGEPIAGLPM